ncbi:voltage-gated potassium channel [Mumia flava]|uniref:Voltage-gated potassium channel n=1 Tax=Mumia flava TaxID=1348852 RepID=A0A0B2BSP9_9ACTN|nr:potassium channel family protein [Mumia flava]PJJ48312.1 voltage-gated potassium channel [Mumia flava]
MPVTLETWEKRAEWPLTAAALVFLAAWAWPILDTDLAPVWVDVCEVVTWLTWGLFAVDYVGRLIVADDRRRFFRRNVVDLVVVVAPMFRPLRVLRLVTLPTVLNRYARGTLRGRVALYVGAAASLIVFVGSVAALNAERGQRGANIDSFGDAIWWALTTVTTVGYGDQFPVTDRGRLIAAGLMLTGIALLGVVTASLASWLIDKVQEIEDESRTATRGDLHELLDVVRLQGEELRRLREEIDRRPLDRDPAAQTGSPR